MTIIMENEKKELFGAWVQATGTTLSAIGSTPLKVFTENELTSYNLWGNELQALGNALIADSEPYFTMEKIGNMIQSAGNLTVIAGILLPGMQQELDIKGNLMQALGGSAVLKDTLTEEQSVESLYHYMETCFKSSGIHCKRSQASSSFRAGKGKISIPPGAGFRLQAPLLRQLVPQ